MTRADRDILSAMYFGETTDGRALSDEEFDRLPTTIEECVDRSFERKRASWTRHSYGWSTGREAAPPKRLRPKCGAKTRKGQPCQALVVWDFQNNQPLTGRCRLHSGRPKNRIE